MNESRSSRYHRHRRWAAGLALAARAILLIGFARSDAARFFSAGLADLPAPELLVAAVATALFALTLSILGDVIVLPCVWYSRFVLERRYRGARMSLSGWLAGYARTLTLHAGLLTGAGFGVHLVMARWPNLWWVVVGAAFGIVTVVLTHVGPILVLPRLYKVQPLDRPALCARVDALARRVGAQRLPLYELKLGVESAPRAALAGLGPTRRVLLSDSLLADYSDDEIEAVVAHELAHHLNHDVWKTMAFEMVSAMTVCGVAHTTLTWASRVLATGPVGAVASFPLLVLVVGALTVALAPVGHHLSRHLERRADLDAVGMTNRPDALVSGLRRLAEQHLAEERPSALVERLFHTHPPLADRLEAARAAADR